MRGFGIFAALVAAALACRVSTSPEWQDAIGVAATIFVKSIVVPLVELINVPAFVYVMSFVIALAAVTACVAYWFRSVRPRLAHLRAVQRGIGGLPLPGPPDGHAQWPGAMRQLGQLLRRHETFISAWSQFQTQAAGGNGLPNAPFSHFVASEPRQAGHDRGGFMQSLPGYFTSLGLILTFIGLVVALYFAAKGFRSGNMAEARGSIVQLLNAASFKFLTSVTALASAMLISIFLRFCLSLIRHETLRAKEFVEGFLSAWREQLGSAGPDERAADGPTGDILHRVNLLLDAVAQLTGSLDRLIARDGAALEKAQNGNR